jgi:hypothetical protein
MSLLKRLEDEAEMLLAELKARCEQLRNAFGANAHSHIDPLIADLQTHVDAQKPADPAVEAPVAETPAPVVDAASAVDAPATPAQAS